MTENSNTVEVAIVKSAAKALRAGVIFGAIAGAAIGSTATYFSINNSNGVSECDEGQSFCCPEPQDNTPK